MPSVREVKNVTEVVEVVVPTATVYKLKQKSKGNGTYLSMLVSSIEVRNVFDAVHCGPKVKVGMHILETGCPICPLAFALM